MVFAKSMGPNSKGPRFGPESSGENIVVQHLSATCQNDVEKQHCGSIQTLAKRDSLTSSHNVVDRTLKDGMAVALPGL